MNFVESICEVFHFLVPQEDWGMGTDNSPPVVSKSEVVAISHHC